MVIVQGFYGGPYNPPMFKGACPHALAVVSDLVAYKVQCLSLQLV